MSCSVHYMRHGKWQLRQQKQLHIRKEFEEVIQPQLILRKYKTLQALLFHLNIKCFSHPDSLKTSSTFLLYSSPVSLLLLGKAVFLARDKHHLTDLCHLIRHDTPYLFQEYVKESHGRDVRVVLVGGRVIGSMLRCSTDGRMQSNCSLGRQTPKSHWSHSKSVNYWKLSHSYYLTELAPPSPLPHYS